MAERIAFKWDAAEHIDYYQLLENGVLVADKIVEPTFDLMMTDMEQGSYVYQVRGVNAFGEGPLSDPATVNFILPAQPQNLQFSIS